MGMILSACECVLSCMCVKMCAYMCSCCEIYSIHCTCKGGGGGGGGIPSKVRTSIDQAIIRREQMLFGLITKRILKRKFGHKMLANCEGKQAATVSNGKGALSQQS